MTLGWIEYIIVVVSSAGGVVFSKSADDHFDHSRTSEKSMTMNILDAHSVARCGGALLRVKLPPEIDILPCVEVNIDNAFELSRDSTLTFRPTYDICRANKAVTWASGTGKVRGNILLLLVIGLMESNGEISMGHANQCHTIKSGNANDSCRC